MLGRQSDEIVIKGIDKQKSARLEPRCGLSTT